ncbi:response regulator transcription factor [Undibacterium amnicola]|uniref:Response regulator transcription factor n=1 Tax=Undibacterium amnicola TaxID=1834038 RepID=A0ABR6XNC7_9BURK|nr:response regulator transcription factor [Undibacterium amnicola]MBC3831014.1 response regulator transcription factor [Undibacterium amnicola]
MKVLLVDDHSLFRAGLRLLTQSIRPDTEIYEANGINDALELAQRHTDFRLCLLDIHLSNENGLHALTQLKLIAPEIAVVVVSSEDNFQAVSNSLDAGAMGFIPKRSTPTELSAALQRVLNDELYIPPSISHERNNKFNTAPAMSKRQWDVFYCLMRGLPNKLICRELNLSENTVKSHLAAIFRAFDVHTRTQLLIVASKINNLPSFH